jgi:hypothetical protein
MLRLALSQSLRFMCELKPVDLFRLPAAVTAWNQISIMRSSASEDPARETRIAHGKSGRVTNGPLLKLATGPNPGGCRSTQ